MVLFPPRVTRCKDPADMHRVSLMGESVSNRPARLFSAEYGSKGQRKSHPTSMSSERPKMSLFLKPSR